MKKSKLPTLNQEPEDYDKFYSSSKTIDDKDLHEDMDLGPWASEQEKEYFNGNPQKMYYHKRMTRNVKEVLSQLIANNTSNSVNEGILQGKHVVLTEVLLNKACTVITCYWTLIMPTIEDAGGLPEGIQQNTEEG